MADRKENVPEPEASERDIAAGKDRAASDESVAIQKRKLDSIAREEEHKRQETFRSNLAWGALAILWLVISATAFAIFAVAWHYMAPLEWDWLSDDQLARIQTYIFSGAVAAIAGGYIRHNIYKEP